MKNTRSIGTSVAAFLVIALTACLPKAEAGLLGNAVIKGKVTNSCFDRIHPCDQGIPGAKVLVAVEGGVDTAHFFGQRQVLLTAGDGSYQTTVGVPDDIPLKHLYVRIIAAKLSGPPNYVMEETSVQLSSGPGTYQADVALHLVGYGACGPDCPTAFVTGTFRDKETGQRLRGASIDDRVFFSNALTPTFFVADGDGEFFGTIPRHPGGVATQPGQSVTLLAGSDRTSPINQLSPNGLSYLNQNRTVTFNAGQVNELNIALDRDTTRPTIVGRVIDGATGKPIANAVVQTTQQDPIIGGTWGKSAVTDVFGRYAVPVLSPDLIVAETNGAFLTLKDGTVPYQTQRVDLSGRLLDGQVFVQDFTMVPRTVVSQTPWQTNASGTLTTDLNYNSAMGYHFTPLVNGQVTALGGFFKGTKVVKLFNKASGQLLATATATANNSWGYASITPVRVFKGVTYTVAVYLAGSGGSYRQLPSDKYLPQTFGNIRIEASTSISTKTDPNARPTNSYPGYSMYGQADITFVADLP